MHVTSMYTTAFCAKQTFTLLSVTSMLPLRVQWFYRFHFIGFIFWIAFCLMHFAGMYSYIGASE